MWHVAHFFSLILINNLTRQIHKVSTFSSCVWVIFPLPLKNKPVLIQTLFSKGHSVLPIHSPTTHLITWNNCVTIPFCSCKENIGYTLLHLLTRIALFDWHLSPKVINFHLPPKGWIKYASIFQQVSYLFTTLETQNWFHHPKHKARNSDL